MCPDIAGVMDADMSHDPCVIPLIIKEFKNSADFVIASRYAKNGGINEWGLYRKFISRFATFMVRPLTSAKDPLSGFFFVRKNVINSMQISPESCKICLEILVKGRYGKIVEVPYIFVNRKFGKSKILNHKEILKYMMHVMSLYSYKIISIFK
ncbi:MAG: glycosyltransferase, partial [Candidatus Aenigmarchaeota archaeon]|nr:glycosyltransferase [Candidatus Aenigmarchaeota archaeon]MDI6722575.1 glycosyltransferase [Candidatus Aenigmarchaeota archaeon]